MTREEFKTIMEEQARLHIDPDLIRTVHGNFTGDVLDTGVKFMIERVLEVVQEREPMLFAEDAKE